ncbi:MAG TPA: VWA domain-containing protein [Blastocatellia bacterium]|nr:VWA domain-containing protein [Blastocatellia bacterium]
MTLRLRRHFSIRIALCAAALAFFGTLPLVCPAPAEFYTVHSQEQAGPKKQDDHQWKIQVPAPGSEQKAKGEQISAPGGEQKDKVEQKKQDEPLLRIETELVQIDAVVTDKKGQLARDLKRADFELFDDGKKQEITHFAIGTAAQPARWLTVEKRPAEKSSSDSAPAEIRAGRYIVIAVDDFHLATENLIIAKRALNRFINNQMVAGDQVAIATTSGNVGMLQQFTEERDVLERAVNRLNVQQRTVTSSSDIPRITDYQAELIDIGDQDALELAVQEIMRLEPMPSPPPAAGRGGRGGFNPGGLDGGASQRERAIQQAQSRARAIVAQNAHYTRATLSNLEGVIRNLRNMTGRKMLVLLSDGFYLGGKSSSQTYDMRRIIDAATRAGVVIYSIDARGLIAAPPGGSASDSFGADDINLPGVRSRVESSGVQAKLDGLNALASDTGGTLFKNSNDLSLGLQRVLDANETYYVLAYEPSTPYRDGRFHKIEVRIAGNPELTVRTRKGYFAPSEKAGAAGKTDAPAEKSPDKRKERSPEKIAQQEKLEKEKEMREGLGSLVPLREIPVEMAIDFLDLSKGSSGALVNLHVDASQLTLRLLNGTHQSALDLLMALFDEKGKVAASFVERINVNIRPERLDTARKNGFSYRRLMALKPGFYQARVAIREEGSARMGSASKWVEVSDIDKKQLTLSGVLLSAGMEVQNDLQLANSAYIPQPSSATRRFKKDGAIDFMVFAYNAKVEKNTADLVIQSQVFSGSKLVYASPIAKMTIPESVDLQRIPYAARVSLEQFNSGPYELRVVVIDRLTKATTFRRVYFTVE